MPRRFAPAPAPPPSVIAGSGPGPDSADVVLAALAVVRAAHARLFVAQPARSAVTVVERGIPDQEMGRSWTATAAGPTQLPLARPVSGDRELVLEEWHGLHCEYFLG